jgi:glycosyltransferase involved in cell wall biosynthesis
MNTPPVSEPPVAVLIGNYPLDRQESMLRFRDFLQAQLEARGFPVESIFPRGYLGPLAPKGSVAKWLAYVDKYIFFPPRLAWRLSAIRRRYPDRKIVVQICDHSNAVYAPLARRRFPVVSICHDLLAVRGALGEDTDCPASGFGKLLQRAILRGLGQANAVICISRATRADLIRLAGPAMAERSRTVHLVLNYPYRPVSREDALAVLAQAGIDLPFHGYVLHVGSGLKRKNRGALLEAVARIKNSWTGQIAFAGEALSPEERALARSLGVEDRVREISRPDNETLVALYCAAHCLIFMSRFEGFGWPVLEAQSSGCPVICSNRTSVPEVAGEGALIREPDDYASIAADIRRLQEPAFRDSLVAKGFENAKKFSIDGMIDAYEEVYRQI